MHGATMKFKIHNSWIKKYFKNNLLESLNTLAAVPEGSNLLTVKFTTEPQDPKQPPFTLCPHDPPPYKSDFLSPSSCELPLLSPLSPPEFCKHVCLHHSSNICCLS